MVFKKTLVAAAAFAQLALAQQTIYGQCGGIGWSGPFTCASGLTCVYFHEYYSQCLAVTATTTTAAGASSSTKASSSSTKASSSSVLTSSTKASSSSSSTKASSSSVSSTKASSSSTKASSTASSTKMSTTSSAATASTTAIASGNPFSGIAMYANPYYASEISTTAIPSLTGAMATKAALVAKVPTFVWLDTMSKVPLMGTFLANIRAANLAGASPPIAGTFVVYDLPDRDCAALASNGEYSIANNGLNLYKLYIDAIRALVVQYSDVKIILVIEPDSLANLVTNMNVAKCSGAHDAYLAGTQYAITQLNLPNVAMYLDAGHGGWLGWSANIGPAATLFNTLYAAAGSPAAVRGLATNVANYNAWSVTTCASYTAGDANCDEKKYVNALAPLLTPAIAHFITDTSRNGVQPTAQNAWGDWCNLIGTGFGVRPTTATGDVLEDAFVWIKPGGECDGTSDTTAVRYDAHCGLPDALKPAPEAGSWFQAYFEQLLTNANPSF